MNRVHSLHKCTRCIGGQTYLEQDSNGNWQEICMLCGYSRDLPKTTPRYSSSSPEVIKGAKQEGKQ